MSNVERIERPRYGRRVRQSDRRPDLIERRLADRGCRRATR